MEKVTRRAKVNAMERKDKAARESKERTKTGKARTKHSKAGRNTRGFHRELVNFKGHHCGIKDSDLFRGYVPPKFIV